MDNGTADYYMAHDHLNSIVALLNSAGAVVERYEYDAYGARRIYDAGFTTRTASNYTQTIAFTGQRLDTLDGGALAVMYYKNRYYDPDTGRFLSRDPLGVTPGVAVGNPFGPTGQYKDGLVVYEYVKNNPLGHLDILGLENSMDYPETLGGCAQKGMEALGGLAKEYFLTHYCDTNDPPVVNMPVCKDGKKPLLKYKSKERYICDIDFPPTGGIWGPFIDANRGVDPPPICKKRKITEDYECRCPCPPGMRWDVKRHSSFDTSTASHKENMGGGVIQKCWWAVDQWVYGCIKNEYVRPTTRPYCY